MLTREFQNVTKKNAECSISTFGGFFYFYFLVFSTALWFDRLFGLAYYIMRKLICMSSKIMLSQFLCGTRMMLGSCSKWMDMTLYGAWSLQTGPEVEKDFHSWGQAYTATDQSNKPGWAVGYWDGMEECHTCYQGAACVFTKVKVAGKYFGIWPLQSSELSLVSWGGSVLS